MAKTIATLDAKIDRTKDSLGRLQREYDQVAGELRALQKERMALEERAIIQAYQCDANFTMERIRANEALQRIAAPLFRRK